MPRLLRDPAYLSSPTTSRRKRIVLGLGGVAKKPDLRIISDRESSCINIHRDIPTMATQIVVRQRWNDGPTLNTFVEEIWCGGIPAAGIELQILACDLIHLGSLYGMRRK